MPTTFSFAAVVATCLVASVLRAAQAQEEATWLGEETVSLYTRVIYLFGAGLHHTCHVLTFYHAFAV